MGDAGDEKFEMNDGPVDSQEPLTFSKGGYSKDQMSEKNRKKDIRSFCLSVFNLMNAILGSGILGLAEAMKNLGMVVFYVLLIMTAVLAGITINLLLAASDASRQTTYEGLAVKSFGKIGKVVTSIMIIIHCLGAMCSYVFIIKTEMPEVMQVVANATGTVVGNPIYMNGEFLMVLVVLLVIVPLSSMKDIRFLGYSSAFGMACMLLFTFMVVVKKFSIPCLENETLNTTKTPSEHVNESAFTSSPLHSEDSEQCKPAMVEINSKSAYAVPTMIFAFMCHASMLPIYQELRRPSVKKMRKVAGTSIVLVLVLYILSATFGYLTFHSHVESELLLSYSKYNPSDPLIVFSRVMVLICVTLSVPLLHYPCRKTIITTFTNNPQHFNWLRHILVMVACLTVTVVMVVFIPNIRDIFGLAGATSSASLLILFPCAFYIKLVKPNKNRKLKRALVRMLFVAGVAFMILSVVLIIVDWATSSSESSEH